MGKQKGAQDKGPNLGSIPNKDLIHRMNFLYQVASHLSQHSETVVPEGDNNKTGGKRRKRKGTLKDLAAFHVRTMKAIGTKSMVRMDPSIKRSICKACSTVMEAGLTSRTRIKPSRVHRFLRTYTCSNCGWSRRIPYPPQPDLTTVRDPAVGLRESRYRKAATLSTQESRLIRRPPFFQSQDHVLQVQGPRAGREQEAKETVTIDTICASDDLADSKTL